MRSTTVIVCSNITMRIVNQPVRRYMYRRIVEMTHNARI